MTSKLDNLENVLPNQCDKNENLTTEQNDENLNTNPSNENLPDLEHVDLPEDPSANDFYSLNPSGSSYQSLPSLVPTFSLPKPVLKRKKTSLLEVQLERVTNFVRSQEVFTSSPTKRSRVEETLSDCSDDSGDSDISYVSSDNMDTPTFDPSSISEDELFNRENCNNNHFCESEPESSCSKYSNSSSFTNVSMPEDDNGDEEEKPTLKRTLSCGMIENVELSDNSEITLESWVHVPSVETADHPLPSTSSEQPSTSYEPTSSSAGEPSSTSNKSSSVDVEPSSTDQEPSTNDEEPSSIEEELSSTVKDPIFNDEEPSSDDEVPIFNDEEPSSDDGEPIFDDEEPILIEEDPNSVEGAVALDAGPSKEDGNISMKLDLNLAKLPESAAAAQIENRYTDNFKESLLEAQRDGTISPCRVSKDASRNGSCFVSRNASNVVSRLNSGLASPKSPPNSPINGKRNKGPFNDMELVAQLKNLAEAIKKNEEPVNEIEEPVQLENLAEGNQENQEPVNVVNDDEVFVQVEDLAEGAEADHENGEPENVDVEKPVDVEMEIPVEIEEVDDGRVEKPIEEEIRKAVEDEDDYSVDKKDDSIDKNRIDEETHAERVHEILANANRAHYPFPGLHAQLALQAHTRRIRNNVDKDEENVYYVNNDDFVEIGLKEKSRAYIEAAKERIRKQNESRNARDTDWMWEWNTEDSAVRERNTRASSDALKKKSRGFSFRKAKFRGKSIFSEYFIYFLGHIALFAGAATTLGLVWLHKRSLVDSPETLTPFYVC